MAKKDLPPGAQKAKGMEVNISGFHGVHPIETGIAYWYRGHYIYSKAGVPVEPIPFATKKGSHIVGTTVDTAPPFRLGSAPGVRFEAEVAALHRSKVHTWEDQERERKKEDANTGVFGSQKGEIQGLTRPDRRANGEYGFERKLACTSRRGPVTSTRVRVLICIDRK